MSISTTTRKAGPFNGNDATSVFPFGFKVFAQSDVQVVQALLADGSETVLVQGTHYTVTLNTDQENNPGGSVVLLAGALATGLSLTLVSNVPETQPATFTDQGGFYPRLLNAALDRITILAQQLREKLGRALTLPVSAPSDVSTALPLPAARAFLAWAADGKSLANVAGVVDQPVSPVMGPVLEAPTLAAARTAMGAAAAGANSDITQLSALSAVPDVVQTALNFLAADQALERTLAVRDILQTSLRMVADQTSGSAVLYDTVTRDLGRYNPTTKTVSGPFAYGMVSANLEVANGSAGALTRTFTLTVAGVPRCIQTVTVPAGDFAYVSLQFIGYVSGNIKVEVSTAFALGGVYVRGTNSGGNSTCTNFGLMVFPEN